MPAYDPLPYRKNIAKKIKEMISDGVTINVILDSIQRYEDAPKSSQTLYKLYGNDIAEARAELHSYLGKKARTRIDEGSDRILELALRSKAGWNPTQSVTVTEGDPDDPDENTSAIEELRALLGRSKPSE